MIERFTLKGHDPGVDLTRVADALTKKGVSGLEPGANRRTSAIACSELAARLAPQAQVFVNLPGLSRGHTPPPPPPPRQRWQIGRGPVKHGLRVAGVRPSTPLCCWPVARGNAGRAYLGIGISTFPRERGAARTRPRKSSARRDVSVSLAPGEALTLVLFRRVVARARRPSRAWGRRAQHEERLVAAWTRARPEARTAPDCDSSTSCSPATSSLRNGPLPRTLTALTVIAATTGRATGTRHDDRNCRDCGWRTGRAEIATTVLTTFARFVDRGMLREPVSRRRRGVRSTTPWTRPSGTSRPRAYHAATD